MNVAVIGYGRFGRLLAHALKTHARVGVVDRRGGIAIERGIERITLTEAAGRRLILLAVPVRSLRAVLTSLAPLLGPGAIVADVCAVKEEPMAWMRAILPSTVSFCGTHPLFGPDSVSGSLEGNSIVLCPGRISPENLRKVSRLFSRLGLTSHTMTPASHDRQIATALLVTQVLGRSLGHLPRSEASTPNAAALRRIIDSSRRDSWALVEDLFNYNRHAREMAARLVPELRTTLRRLPRR